MKWPPHLGVKPSLAGRYSAWNELHQKRLCEPVRQQRPTWTCRVPATSGMYSTSVLVPLGAAWCTVDEELVKLSSGSAAAGFIQVSLEATCHTFLCLGCNNSLAPI